MTVSTAQATRRAWMAWIAICIVWGTTYLAIKVGLQTIPPLLLGGFRYLGAAAIMVPLLRYLGRPLPPRRTWTTQAVLGFLMLGLGNGGVVTGELYLTSGLTAVLVGTSPFWMTGIDALFSGGARLTGRQLAGMLLGFTGIVVLVWKDLSIGPGGSAVLLGVIAVQVACLGWALASSYTKRHVVAADVLGVATLQMFFGGLFMTIGGLARGEWSHLSFTWPTFSALAYLTVFGSVIAFVSYSYALRHLPIAVVSLYTYVNPVIAVALGIVLLHEPFEMRQLLAAAIIGAGMVVVRTDKVTG